MATWICWKKGLWLGERLPLQKTETPFKSAEAKNVNVFLTSLRDSRGQAAFGPNVSRIQMRPTGFFFSLLGSAGFVFRQALFPWCQGGCWQFQDQNVHAVPETEREREQSLFWELWKASGSPFIGLVCQSAQAAYGVVTTDIKPEAQQPGVCLLAHIARPMHAADLQAPRMMDTLPLCSCTTWNLRLPLLLQHA